MDLLSNLGREVQDFGMTKFPQDSGSSLLANLSFQGKSRLRSVFKRKSTPVSAVVNFDEKDLRVPEGYDGPVIGDNDDPIDLETVVALMEFFARDEERLPRRFVYRILERADTAFRAAPVMTELDLPKEGVVNIIGDVHGQLYDLLKIFKLRGRKPDDNQTTSSCIRS